MTQLKPISDEAAGRTTMTFGRLLRLCHKELREVLRDRRTIITLIGMPLLVYPLLSLTFQKFLLTSGDVATTTPCIVGFDTERDRDRVGRYLELGEELARREAAAKSESAEARRNSGAGQSASPNGAASEPNGAGLPGTALASPPSRPEVILNLAVSPDAIQHLSDGIIDVAIRVLPQPDEARLPAFGEPLHCEILYRADSALSQAAKDAVEERLGLVNNRFVRQRFEQINGSRWLPAEFTAESITSQGSMLSITTVLPLILILMTITGAVYPAIDVTAGERERGTLEALVAAPVPRLALLASKYVAVVTVAVLTAAANMLAMTVTVVITPWGRTLFDAGGISVAVIAQVFVLLILFAAFFSAILLAITSFARSFKEAQAYLIPLMLVSLAPGILSLMPGIELNGLLAVTPLLNMVLLARGLLEGQVEPGMAAIAILSTTFYAVSAIALAARIFGTDAMLSGSRFSWQDLFLRSEDTQPAARPAGALACLAVMFPIYFLLSNLLALLPVSQSVKLVLAAFVTMLLFGLLPLVAAWFQRVDVRDGFNLHPGTWATYLAGLILGLSLWPVVEQLFLMQGWIGLVTISEDKLRQVQALLDEWRDVSPWLIVATMAIAPAVFEEFFFRGYLFRSLGHATSRLRDEGRPALFTVIVSAVLFGLFHVVTPSVLAVERFVPSTLLGLILGVLCLRAGSIWPGVVLHACHNGLLLMMAYYRDQLSAWGFGSSTDSNIPWQWLMLSVVGMLIAGGLLLIRSPSASKDEKADSSPDDPLSDDLSSE